MRWVVLIVLIAILVWSQFPITNDQLPNNDQITNNKIVPTSPPTPVSKFVSITPLDPPLNLRGGNPVGEVGDFPFTVQAPDGEWENPIFQDGCEEAAVLMLQCSMFKVQCPMENGNIDKEWAREEIIKISRWQVENYGSSTDTSAEDTAERLLAEYYKLSGYEVRKLSDKSELTSGVWIVPMDGRKLDNPYYTAPGPERHMVLVIGYDAKTDELITNDAGTKRGKNYRYKLDVFWEAIRDYPSGDHEPIIGIEKNAILINIQ